MLNIEFILQGDLENLCHDRIYQAVKMDHRGNEIDVLSFNCQEQTPEAGGNTFGKLKFVNVDINDNIKHEIKCVEFIKFCPFPRCTKIYRIHYLPHQLRNGPGYFVEFIHQSSAGGTNELLVTYYTSIDCRPLVDQTLKYLSQKFPKA